MKKCRVLLLAGTSEARQLARRLAPHPDLEVIASLAGATAAPRPLEVSTRIGGFGGASGLANFLRAENIGLIINATHPYAEQMTQNAQLAAQYTGTPYMRLLRPAWTPASGDNWINASDIGNAFGVLPSNARIFFATGSGSAPAIIDAARSRPDLLIVLRTVNDISLPDQSRLVHVKAPPSFHVADETQLLHKYRITHLVSKNSGGHGADAKLVAARKLGLPVIMIDRPQVENLHFPAVQTVNAANEWICGQTKA